MKQKKLKKKKCKVCDKLFPLYNSFQKVCSPKCALKFVKEKNKVRHEKLREYLKPDRLRNKTDALFQEKGKRLYPKSIISGDPTEVIHHWIYKSQSNNTRYDLDDNAIPLTIKEHDIIHNQAKRTELELQICTIKGIEWQNRLLANSRVICKLTNGHLTDIIDKLTHILDNR